MVGKYFLNSFFVHRYCGTWECGIGKIVPVRMSLMISSASTRSHASLRAGFSTGVGQGFAIGVQIESIIGR